MEPVANETPVTETGEQVEAPSSGAQGGRKAARQRYVLFGGLALLVVVLAAAAYVGATWLGRGRQTATGGSGPQMMLSRSGGGKGGVQSTKLDIIPAPEVPQSGADQKGIFTRRQDNSIFIGTGQIKMMFTKPEASNATPSSSASYDGPVIEVVVTHDTQVWRDETDFMKAGSDGKVQQVVKPGTVEDIASNAIVNVWGQRSGDRIVADTLVYQNH